MVIVEGLVKCYPIFLNSVVILLVEVLLSTVFTAAKICVFLSDVVQSIM